MAVDRVRHGAQIRLSEIGETGQARLASSEVALRTVGHAREVEAAYLERSGLHVDASARASSQAVRNAETCAEASTYAAVLASLGMHDVAAREVADGALRALFTMRKVLGIEASGGTS